MVKIYDKINAKNGHLNFMLYFLSSSLLFSDHRALDATCFIDFFPLCFIPMRI